MRWAGHVAVMGGIEAQDFSRKNSRKETTSEA